MTLPEASASSSKSLPARRHKSREASGIVSGHERAHDRQVGEQCRRALQRDFPLLLKTAECGNRIFEVALDSETHFLLHVVPHHQQSCERQCRRNHNHGEQELGPQPNSAHGQILKAITGSKL